MDALIERYMEDLLQAAMEIAEDKSIPVFERFFKTLHAMNRSGYIPIFDEIHKPQNALMHEKIQAMLLSGIPPILAGIIEDGIEENLFNTPYPYETIEMVIAFVNTVFDNYTQTLSKADLEKKVEAFIFNLERLFGASPGSFSPVLTMFGMEDSGL